jgi:sulfur-oxidizing protein SoxZ
MAQTPAATRALINAPARAKRGEVIEVKTLASHPMETGFRPDASGNMVPRDIIKLLVCTYNGVEVFRADLHPSISANPYVAFHTVAAESGSLAVAWTDDKGQVVEQKVEIAVE